MHAYRLNLFTTFFNFVAKNVKAVLMPVTFILDITDGTRCNTALFKDLGLPILGQSIGRNEHYVLPIPDTHMVAGYAVLFKWFDVPRDMSGFAQSE